MTPRELTPDSGLPVGSGCRSVRCWNSEAFHHMSRIDDIVAALRCDDDQFDFGLRVLLRGIAARIESEDHRDE